MVEKTDKTTETKAETTKAPESLNEKDMLKLVNKMTEEQKQQFREAMGIPKVEKKETPPVAEKPTETPADPHAQEAGHTPHEVDAHAPVPQSKTVPDVASDMENSPVAYSPRDAALTVGGLTAASLVAGAAANSVPLATYAGLSTGPAALATYTMLQNAVTSIPLIGSWIPTSGSLLATAGATAMVAPLVGAGLSISGKILNTGVRWFINKKHQDTGIDPFRNMWYGIKFPFMAAKYIWNGTENEKTKEKEIWGVKDYLGAVIGRPLVAAKDWTAANTGTIAKGAGVGLLVGGVLGTAALWPPLGVASGLAAMGAYVGMNYKSAGEKPHDTTTKSAHANEEHKPEHAEVDHHQAA